ncbi:MAG: OmpA family protein [Rhodocyclales bacterium]|nr:OmpA family protein [Rhodocyclales bacterium]
MTNNSKRWCNALFGAVVVVAAGCSSLKTPATADVADAQRQTLLARGNAAESRRQTQAAESDADEAQRQTLLARGNAAESERQMQAAQARTAILEVQLADLAATQTARGLVITLGDVLFGTDLARLNADGMRTTQKLADVLQRHPQRTVLIEGFTDSTGSAAHNQELSERRADAVRGALQEMGVAHDRIAIRGYGETHPVAANDTKENRQLNRRVEIVFSGDGGLISQR